MNCLTPARMTMLLVVFLPMLCLSGCWHLGVYEEELTENYRLSALDTRTQMALMHYDGEVSVGVVDPTVVAVGCTGTHLIVKQHPRRPPSDIDTTVTNYYIVEIPEDPTLFPYDGVIGPLSESEFEKQTQELGVSADALFIQVLSVVTTSSGRRSFVTHPARCE